MEGDASKDVAAHIFVSGRVQGVGFRSFTQDQALSRSLLGFSRNLSDGRVEIKVEGDRLNIEALILDLKKGSHRSRVDGIDVSWEAPSSRFHNFSITY